MAFPKGCANLDKLYSCFLLLLLFLLPPPPLPLSSPRSDSAIKAAFRDFSCHFSLEMLGSFTRRGALALI